MGFQNLFRHYMNFAALLTTKTGNSNSINSINVNINNNNNSVNKNKYLYKANNRTKYSG